MDPEISTLCGPQLVVPSDNARFVLNAANARWGSLKEAFMSTDAIEPKSSTSSPEAREAVVMEAVVNHLDDIFPLTNGLSHADTSKFSVTAQGKLIAAGGDGEVGGGGLLDESAFVGFTGTRDAPSSLLLVHNGLHMELLLKDHHKGGGKGGVIKDVVVEAALSAIIDCEDSVAVVDGEDKAVVYTNWAGLMKGDLTVKLPNGSVRSLHKDKTFHSPTPQEMTTEGGGLEGQQQDMTVGGRAMLLVRNVGLHMTTKAVTRRGGEPIFEGILDAFATTAGAMHSLTAAKKPPHVHTNSACGSVYVVKPKLHGAEEVRFTCALFDRVEEVLGLPRNTVKLGIMDEERRTSVRGRRKLRGEWVGTGVFDFIDNLCIFIYCALFFSTIKVNLSACVEAAADRVVFINTGFLDRTGDEIHTTMECGPSLPKEQCKQEPWYEAYEENNVAVGLAMQLPGKGQIGKGMWAKTDNMKEMMKTKQAHPASGASCAWVPSPTAAVLHALHYHQVSVLEARKALLGKEHASGGEASQIQSWLVAMLTPPLMTEASRPSKEALKREVESNAQAILGYVVRWVNQGVGCSKVLNLDGVALMEDRATLRISSQQLANWVHHGVVEAQEVEECLTRMALVVDEQNKKDPFYTPMGSNPKADSIAFNCAYDLIFNGVKQPGGYTEEALTNRRLQVKEHGPHLEKLLPLPPPVPSAA